MATVTMEEQTTVQDALDPSNWTVPQELCLLQAITNCKPVGLHKHFRMLNIIEALQNSGTIPQPVDQHKHCSTPEGIWRKLESLYDLKALDEREDAIFADVAEDSEDGAATEYWREFELKGDDFEESMWDRRLAPDGDEDWSDEDVGARVRESTVADSDDPRSSPVGSVRGVRSSGRRAVGKRLAEVRQDDSPAGSGKGSRRTSKAASPSVKDEEDTEMRDADEDDEEDDDEEESGHDDADDGKKGRTTRARGVRRGRGRRGRRGK